MSITITGGFTMAGGGFTLVAAPPPSEATAGWYGGGYLTNVPTIYSRVDRIIYATDTATASVRGPLSIAKFKTAATGNSTNGWFAGGFASSPNFNLSSVDRITYATDTVTASQRGPLTQIVTQEAATSTTTDGWFGGGSSRSSVERITYATDTATASLRGPLSQARYSLAAAGNTTYGWFGGGYASGVTVSTVDRITYATDTDIASVRGPLSAGQKYLAATGNITDGWFAGGSYPMLSVVQRITYATDTATASVRGPLSLARSYLAASGNETAGWFGGGAAYSGSWTDYTTVDRITYATDTATASVRGPLSLARDGHGGSSGIQ